MVPQGLNFVVEVSGRRLNTAFSVSQWSITDENNFVPCSYSETPLLGEMRKLRCDWGINYECLWS